MTLAGLAHHPDHVMVHRLVRVAISQLTINRVLAGGGGSVAFT